MDNNNLGNFFKNAIIIDAEGGGSSSATPPIANPTVANPQPGTSTPGDPIQQQPNNITGTPPAVITTPPSDGATPAPPGNNNIPPVTPPVETPGEPSGNSTPNIEEGLKGKSIYALQSIYMQSKGWIPEDAEIKDTLTLEEFEALISKGYETKLTTTTEEKLRQIEQAKDLVDYWLETNDKDTIQELIPIERLLRMTPSSDDAAVNTSTMADVYGNRLLLQGIDEKTATDLVKLAVSQNTLESHYTDSKAYLEQLKSKILTDKKTEQENRRNKAKQLETEKISKFNNHIQTVLTTGKYGEQTLSKELTAKLQEAFFGPPVHEIKYTDPSTGAEKVEKNTLIAKYMHEILTNPELQLSYAIQRLTNDLLPSEIQARERAKAVKNLLKQLEQEAIVNNPGVTLTPDRSTVPATAGKSIMLIDA